MKRDYELPMRPFHIEADLRPSSLDKGQYTCGASEFSIVEHPFRVLIHDEDCYLMIVATTTFGPGSDVDEHTLRLIQSFRGWVNAIILNRVDLSVHRVVARGAA